MTSSNDSVAAQFQKNRAVAWTSSKPWIGVAIVGFCITALTGNSADSAFNLRWGIGMVGMLIVIAAIGRLVWIVKHTYQCPNCKKVPMSRNYILGTSFGYEDQVNLDPEACSNCGVRLK